MPYSGVSDPNLPSNVKKMPSKRRRQWVSIFNRTMASCTGDDCEAKAFRIANGVLKRQSKDMDIVPVQCQCGEWNEVDLGEKELICEHCHTGMKMVWKDDELEDEKCYDQPSITYYKPYGGAISFEEVDAYHEASEMTSNVNMAKYMFDSIYENINSDDEMSPDEKVTSVEKATKEMIKRMQNPKHSMKDTLKSIVFGQKRTFSTEERKRLAKTGAAMPDGGYPIVTVEDLKNAIRAIGRAANPAAAKRHIKKRARSLDKSDLIPKEWGSKEADSLFIVTKGINGDWRWLAIFTNKFRDREGEIFSDTAHKEYEAWVDETKQYPELRMWHIPGSGVGHADCITYADGFMVASGGFSKGNEDVAERLAGLSNIGVSHGFAYRESDLTPDGVYKRYRTFELSALPIEKAANNWTAFTLELLKKEVEMGLNPDKREFLVKALGEERVGRLEEVLPQLSKDLEEAGVGWKDLAEAMDSESDTDVETTVEDKESDKKPEDKKPEDEEKKTEDKSVDIKELTGAFKELLAPLAEAITQLQTDIKELEKSDDEKIAARVGPRTDVAALSKAKKPTDADDNVIDPEKTKDLDKVEPKDESPTVAAARAIVDELMLGRRADVNG